MILAETARPSQMEITFDIPQWQETHLVLFSLRTAMCYWHSSSVSLSRETLFFLMLSASGSRSLSKALCLFGLHWEPLLNFLFVSCKTCKGTPQLLHLQLCSHNKVLKIKELAQGNCLIWERLYRQWTSVSQLRLMALSAVSCARRCLPKKILKNKFFFQPNICLYKTSPVCKEAH